MGAEVLKKYNFSEESLSGLNQANIDIIENYFNDQEKVNISKEQIIKASVLLEPIIGKIEIINFFDYVSNLKINQRKTNSQSDPDSNNNSNNNTDNHATIDKKFEKSDDDIEFFLKNKNNLCQVWVLEHLINNTQLLNKDDDIEIVKKKLKEKELELNIRNFVMDKFFESLDTIKDIHVVLNFKTFEFLKKDLAGFILFIQKKNPLDPKSFIEIYRERGFEEGYDTNAKVCHVLSSIIKDPKLQKILLQVNRSFPKLNFDQEKKRFIRKNFS